MSTDQQTLAGRIPEHIRGRGHLELEEPARCASTLFADPSRSEAWCHDCDHRITVGTIEAGHAPDCEHFEGVEA